MTRQPRSIVTILLATVLLAPAWALAAPPTAAGVEGHAPVLPIPEPLPEGVCLPQGCLDVPLLVDEHGDTMVGDLTMEADVIINGVHKVRFAGGDLEAHDTLTFAGDAVCLEGAPASGCGTITAVLAGRGLLGGGRSGDITLAVDPKQVQDRVSGACASGSSIAAIAEDGTVTCEPDNDSGGDITSITAGTGLLGGGTSGDVAVAVDTTKVCMAFQPGPGCQTAGWLLTGNVGTNPSVNFLGTTDNQPLNLRTDNINALRLTPFAGGVTVVVGPSNAIAAGVRYSTIAGGSDNTIKAGVVTSTIAGGGGHVIEKRAAADPAFPSHSNFIGGGSSNKVTTDAGGFVGAGEQNTATGQSASAVVAGKRNLASNINAVVAGGQDNQAVGENAFVGGGVRNVATLGSSAVVAGIGNAAGADAFVGAGAGNQATGSGSFVGGGGGNRALSLQGVVVGGSNNQATSNWASVVGGERNVASQEGAIVAAGRGNTASGVAAGVLAGDDNVAPGGTSAVASGRRNTASGQNAFVGAGDSNVASGANGVVAGGQGNVAAGGQSWAGGFRAKALSNGAFVWADSPSALAPDLVSPSFNTFTVRATGGTTFYTDVDATAGVRLASGSGAWSTLSDRAMKEGIEPADARDVLARVAAMPMNEWSYTTQPAVRHMGPMAQDFRAAFGLGEDERTISTVDADGVALAAIQGLNSIVEEQGATIQAQQAHIDALEARLAALEAALAGP